MDNDIKIFSDFLAKKAFDEAETHPIDRFFLEPFIERILSLERNDFLIYNLDNNSTLYSVYLMLCLPELWQEISVDNIIDLIKKIKSNNGLYSLILFTYKFIEVDITPIIFDIDSISQEVKLDIKNYLRNQYPNLLKTETDLFFFNENLYGVDIETWLYIKQKLLLDGRLIPSLSYLDELKSRFSKND